MRTLEIHEIEEVTGGLKAVVISIATEILIRAADALAATRGSGQSDWDGNTGGSGTSDNPSAFGA
jgi:hypothetical protein